jgi:hypothetical protein
VLVFISDMNSHYTELPESGSRPALVAPARGAA